MTLDLDKAIEIALSENPTIKVADIEITRKDYSRKGAIGNLFPTITASGDYSRTLKKQVMYMDMDIPGMDNGMKVGQVTLILWDLIFSYRLLLLRFGKIYNSRKLI